MRLVTYPAIIAFLVIGLASPPEADAQCRRRVIVGPGVTVVGPCQPPPPAVVVTPTPPPPPATAAPPPPPPPPNTNVAPAPCDVPPPPRVRRRYRRVRLFTMGLYGEGTMFKKGGMGGGGFYAQLRLGRAFHLYGSVGASGSCTTCDPDNYQRTDIRTSFGLQWYMARRNWKLQPFFRGTLVHQAVKYRDPLLDEGSILKQNQFGVEVAFGLEWRPLRWLTFSADVAYLGLARVGGDDDINPQQAILNDSRMGGVPTVDKTEHGANFRFSAALRF